MAVRRRFVVGSGFNRPAKPGKPGIANVVVRRAGANRTRELKHYALDLVHEPQTLAEQLSGLGIVTKLDRAKLFPTPFHYNASILRRADGLWLSYRAQQSAGHSEIVVVRLGGDFQPDPATNKRLDFGGNTEGHAWFEREDARLFHYAGSVWTSFTCWLPPWRNAIGLARLGADWSVQEQPRLHWANNWAGTQQKNWGFFEHDGKLTLLYQPDPHEVVAVGSDWVGSSVSRSDRVNWAYGQLRGGSPPQLVGDHYLVFFHSSQHDARVGRRRYYMGAYEFSASTFEPTSMTREPLLVGTAREEYLSWAPIVVFPCGAVLDGDSWLVSLGVNDCWTAIARLNAGALRARMTRL